MAADLKSGKDNNLQSPAFEPDLEGEIECKNPFDVDTLDLLIPIDTSAITNPSFRSPTAVFMSRMRKRFGHDKIKYMSTLKDTKTVFIAAASKQFLPDIHAFAKSTLDELARPQGTKLRIKISNLSGCLHQKALRRGLTAYGKVLHLTMRSAQSEAPKNANHAAQSKAANANFGTSAVCIIEIHHGKKLPGKLSWLLGGHRVVMPVTLLPLDPPKPKDFVDRKTQRDSAPPTESGPAAGAEPGPEPSTIDGKHTLVSVGPHTMDLPPVSHAKFLSLVEDDQLAEAKVILQRQPDILQRQLAGEQGERLVPPLALCTSVAMATLLLEAKADVNAVDDELESALFSITNVDLIPLFVDHKIDLMLKNQNGWTALQYWQDCLRDCEDPEAPVAQAMVSALQQAEQNVGWNNVTTKGKKRAHSRSRSRSPPRSRSPLAHGRAAEEA